MTPANHKHDHAARPGRAANRWMIVCLTCGQVVIPAMLSERGAQTLAKELNGVCREPGCSNPVYVNEGGIGTQVPYRAKLCVHHIMANFRAVGIYPPMMEERVKV